MSEHPHDSLPAFVLGILEADEALLVDQHIAICAACRSGVAEFRAIVGMFPYAPAPEEPPPYVKRQLFARIDVGPEAPAARVTPAPSGARGRMLGAGAMIAMALVLLLVLASAGMYRDLDNQRQMFGFLAAPETFGQRLQHTARAPDAGGMMYMQRGRNRAMLVVSGLQPPEQGKIYRCWFESSTRQVPADRFTVNGDGTAQLFVTAPEPVDSYSQIKVTVEQSDEIPTPGGDVVLWARSQE
jgi:hypothetical protein